MGLFGFEINELRKRIIINKNDMKETTEIVFKDELIGMVDSLLNLKRGDKFYFSLRDTSPKSESEYKESLKNYRSEIVDGVIAEINEESKKYHIMHFKVIKVSKSYTKDYGLSISNPQETYIETITVREVIKIRWIYYDIRNYIREIIKK